MSYNIIRKIALSFCVLLFTAAAIFFMSSVVLRLQFTSPIDLIALMLYMTFIVCSSLHFLLLDIIKIRKSRADYLDYIYIAFSFVGFMQIIAFWPHIASYALSEFGPRSVIARDMHEVASSYFHTECLRKHDDEMKTRYCIKLNTLVTANDIEAAAMALATDPEFRNMLRVVGPISAITHHHPAMGRVLGRMILVINSEKDYSHLVASFPAFYFSLLSFSLAISVRITKTTVKIYGRE